MDLIFIDYKIYPDLILLFKRCSKFDQGSLVLKERGSHWNSQFKIHSKVSNNSISIITAFILCSPPQPSSTKIKIS